MRKRVIPPRICASVPIRLFNFSSNPKTCHKRYNPLVSDTLQMIPRPTNTRIHRHRMHPSPAGDNRAVSWAGQRRRGGHSLPEHCNDCIGWFPHGGRLNSCCRATRPYRIPKYTNTSRCRRILTSGVSSRALAEVAKPAAAKRRAETFMVGGTIWKKCESRAS